MRAILDRHGVTQGLVVSIQSFGSYAANLHPHVHVLLSHGTFTEKGEFLQLPYLDARLVEEGTARYETRGPRYRLNGGKSVGEAVIGLGAAPGRPPSWVAAIPLANGRD